jgi:conjugative relaxase-like TrwC/TraI family protein
VPGAHTAAVLTIGKLGHGQQAYYLAAVAEGAEDYYLYAGEAPGRWAGGGSGRLGLSGEVAGADFTSLLRGEHPRTMQPLGSRAGKVPGFDLTFSAPKSVSVLFGLGDERLAGLVRAAHDAAVDDALGYLQEVASHGRRGRGGLVRIRSEGFVAAVFRHRTSRAGDPNLHSHVVIANRVLGVDGKWTALDARAVYQQARTAGHLYQASLRYELRELGLTWTVGRNGLGEAEEVPRGVRREFSTRRREIEQLLDERGLASAKAAQAAALQSRQAKEGGVDPEGLRGRWRHRAQSLGFDMDRLSLQPRQRALTTDLSHLLGADGLTAHASTFGEREVLRAVASALPDGAPVREVRRMTESLLASSAVVPLSAKEQVLRGQDVLRLRRRRVIPTGASERRFTTREILALEHALVTSAVACVDHSPAVVRPEDLSTALAAAPTLNPEQVELARLLTSTPDGVQIVNAPAGSGKTTALAVVVAAYRGSSNHVVGATLSAKAAGVLRDQTGLQTLTVARLLTDLRDPRAGALPQGSVVILDEAGQVGTRALAQILGAVRRAEGKLILVGDPHQLPEIDAGGAYRGLLARLDVLELTQNHRQRDPEEQGRLLELRRGDVAAALRSYDECGLVVRASSGDAVRRRLVEDWLLPYLSAPGESAAAQVVMLGLTNEDVGELNSRAQQRLLEQGRLTRTGVSIGGRDYYVGDHVVTRHNSRRIGVINGERWRVVAAGPTGLQLAPVGRVGGLVDLPASYAEDDPARLQLGYALTVSVAQGSTVDQAFILGSDATYREAGYTAASRARLGTRFYVVGREPLETDEREVLDEQDPLVALVEALNRSAAQELALDQRDGREPGYLDVG